MSNAVNNFKRCFHVLLLVTIVSGCTTAPKTVPIQATDHVKRVGVVSLTSDQFTRQYVGVTVFGNEREREDITSWGIDRAYEDQLAAAAEKVLGAVSVRAGDSAPKFSEVNSLNGPWDAEVFWGPNWNAIEVATRDFCLEHGLDAVLVAAKKKSTDFIGHTNQFIEGAGIYARNTISMIHVLAEVGLLDCATGKPMAVRLLGRGDIPTFLSAMREFVPMKPIQKDISRSPVAQWSEETLVRVRQELVTLPEAVWGDTLQAMLSRK